MNLLFADPAEDRIKESIVPDYYSGLSANMSFSVLKPFLSSATREYLLPLLGRTFYDALITASDDVSEEIKDQLRTALIYYTVFDMMPQINVGLNEGGAQQTTNDKAMPSSQWAFVQKRWGAIVKADRAMDRALAYMVENVENAALTTWKQSAEYTRTVSDYFNGLDTFKQFAQMDSFNSYLKIVPFVRKAEKEFAEDLHPATLAAALGSADPQAVELIRLSRFCISAMALIDAIPHLNAYIDGTGIFIPSSIDGMENSRIGVFSNNNESAIDRLLNTLEYQRDKYLEKVYTYLNRNRDYFTLWAADLPDYKEDVSITRLPFNKGSIMI